MAVAPHPQDTPPTAHRPLPDPRLSPSAAGCLFPVWHSPSRFPEWRFIRAAAVHCMPARRRPAPGHGVRQPQAPPGHGRDPPRRLAQGDGARAILNLPARQTMTLLGYAE